MQGNMVITVDPLLRMFTGVLSLSLWLFLKNMAEDFGQKQGELFWMNNKVACVFMRVFEDRWY